MGIILYNEDGSPYTDGAKWFCSFCYSVDAGTMMIYGAPDEKLTRELHHMCLNCNTINTTTRKPPDFIAPDKPENKRKRRSYK